MEKNLRRFVAEFVGTFALVFVSAGAVCTAHLADNPRWGLLGIAAAQGLALAVALSATAHLAGGYLNPAVTITLWVLRRLDNLETAGFVLAQLLGAALAGALLRLLVPWATLVAARFGAPHVAGAYDTPQLSALAAAGGVELVLTFLLTFVIFATMIDPRAPRPLGGLAVGLVAGLALAALVLAGYDLTGACANPARAVGTSLWEWTYQAPGLREQVFVYWIGPIAGAVLAGLAYVYLILPPDLARHAEKT
jgi:aquaporin Z